MHFGKESVVSFLTAIKFVERVLIIALLLSPYLMFRCSATLRSSILPAPQCPLSDSTFFDYTAFNTPNETVRVLSRDYTNFSVTIDYAVTFNTTTAEPKAIIKIQNRTDSGTVWGLDVTLFETNIIDVNYVVGSNSTKVGGGPYTAGMIVYAYYDGANFTVRDYNNASNVFLSEFSCPNFPLRGIKASGDDFSATAGNATVEVDIISDQVSVSAAHFLLDYTYDSTLGLCSEVYGKGGNSLGSLGQVFWICSDNLLAYYALKQYDENVSNTIDNTLRAYAKNYSLPTDSSGLPISYKHEAILGDVLPVGIPRNPGNNTNGPFNYYKLKNESSVIIGTEVNNGTSWNTWVNYADELAWQGLSCINQNNTAEAQAYYYSMMRMWDGYGFADAAYNGINTPQYGHYEPYKLALAIILRQRLNLPKPPQESTMDDILAACQGPDGGIATGYDKDWSTAGHNENTETTAMVIIANVTRLPAAPPVCVPVNSTLSESSYIVAKVGDYWVAQNGTTGNVDFNDTDACKTIQYCVDTLNSSASGGEAGRILLEGGTIPLSQQVVISNPNIVLEGEDWRGTGLSANFSGDLIQIVSPPHSGNDSSSYAHTHCVSIRNLLFYRDKNSILTQTAIYINTSGPAVYYVDLEHLYIENMNGIRTDPGTKGEGNDTNVLNGNLIGNVIIDDPPSFGVELWSTLDMTLDNLYITWNPPNASTKPPVGTTGIQITMHGESTGIVISDTRVLGADFGITLNGCRDIWTTNVISDLCGTWAWNLHDTEDAMLTNAFGTCRNGTALLISGQSSDNKITSSMFRDSKCGINDTTQNQQFFTATTSENNNVSNWIINPNDKLVSCNDDACASFWMEWQFWTIISIGVVVLAGAILFLRKRKLLPRNSALL